MKFRGFTNFSHVSCSCRFRGGCGWWHISKMHFLLLFSQEKKGSLFQSLLWFAFEGKFSYSQRGRSSLCQSCSCAVGKSPTHSCQWPEQKIRTQHQIQFDGKIVIYRVLIVSIRQTSITMYSTVCFPFVFGSHRTELFFLKTTLKELHSFIIFRIRRMGKGAK